MDFKPFIKLPKTCKLLFQIHWKKTNLMYKKVHYALSAADKHVLKDCTMCHLYST